VDDLNDLASRSPGSPVFRIVAAGVAVVLFAAACWLRPDIAIGLVLLGAVYTTLERIRPVRDQPPAMRRRGWRTDAVHFVVDEVLAAAGLTAVVLIGVPVLRAGMPDLVPATIRSQPSLAVWVEALVLAEVCGYWGHRLTHEIPFLWRFHRVHHSSTQLDWLAPSRKHPLDTIFARSSVALPLLVLGFAVPTVVTHFIIKRFQGLLVHANIDLRLGPLEWIVSTPHFHHWHHADQAGAFKKNYAGQVPLVDWVFGTLYRPTGWPERYGCDGYVPDVGYLAQLLAPWRQDSRISRNPSHGSAVAIATELADVAEPSDQAHLRTQP
jgi:sterol desaturase/sphingolipid hydroxylase (fatty acid hydroxylase superfamily)